MPPLRPPRQPRPSDDTGYNPVPPISKGSSNLGMSAGPVAFTPTTTLPLPPLGAANKANAIPPLQKVTVQLPQAAPMPAMPSLTGRPMGSQALSDAFRYRFMNRIASQMDPESSFANELAAAQQSKAIHDLVYPAATPKDVYQKAQDALVAENYARSLRGEPPIEVANAQAQAAKAQTAAEAAQKEAEADQTAVLAKRMNPAAHYLASPEGLQQYSDENGINLDPSDITRLDEMGRNAASAVVTNQPSAYWNAVGIDLAPPSAGETPAQVGAETPQNSSVTMMLQSPRFAQAYGGSTEGGVHRGNAPAHLKDYYPSGTLPGDYQPPPDRSHDVVGVGADASLNPEGIPASFGHFPGYGQGVLGTASAMGPFPNYADALPLPPGGALPGQPKTRDEMVQGAATAGGVAVSAAALAAGIQAFRGGSRSSVAMGAVAAALAAGLTTAEIMDGRKSPEELAQQAMNVGMVTSPAGQVAGALSRQPGGVAKGGLAGAGAAAGVSLLGNLLPENSPVSQAIDTAGNAIGSGFNWFNTQVANPLESAWIGANLKLPAWLQPQGLSLYTSANAVESPESYQQAGWYDPAKTPAENELNRLAFKQAIAPMYAATPDLPSPLSYQAMVDYAKQRQATNTPFQNVTEQISNPANILPFEAAGRGAEALAGLLGVEKAAQVGTAARTAAGVASALGKEDEVPPVEAAPAIAARPLLVVENDFLNAGKEWNQWLIEHPEATDAEKYAHPAYQQMEALTPELKAAHETAAQPALAAPAEPVVSQAAPTAAAAVVPPVASPPATTTAALVHPVTGENLATGDFQRDTETRLALQELTDAAAQAKLAKGKKQITAATKRLQAAAQAIGGSDTAQVDALIQKAMEPTVTPPVAEAPATGGGLTDLEATQGTELARQQVEREATPLPSEPVSVQPAAIVPPIQPEVTPLAAESAVAPVIPVVPQGKPLEGPVGKATTAFGLTDPNVQYQMRDRIVPLDSLIVSHDISGTENPEFNQAYQNRNRAAMASEQQTNAVAKNTAAESLIADQRALDKGSPIVSPDSMVLGGNGRSLGLLKARASNPAEWEKYQAELRNALPEHGFSEADIAGIKDPVLVREITDPNVTDLAKFAEETNQRPGLALAPLEQAAQDARIISDQAVINMAIGSEGNVDLAIAKNPRLLAAYQQAIPLTARSGLMSASGEMTQDLITRVKRALIYKTYGGSEAGQALAQRFIDGVHVDAAPVQNAILANLPAMAKLEAEIAQGIRSGSLSLTEDVAKAFDALVTMKSNGLSNVDEFLAGQGGANVRGKVGGFTVRKPGMENLATPDLTPTQTMLLKFFNQYGRSSATVRDFLDGYVANATATDNLMNLSFMDALNPVDRQTLLNQASATVEEGRAAIAARAEAKQAAADQAAGIQRMDLGGPQVGAQGVAALGLVTPQQPGESDDQYQTRLRLSAGLMAVGLLKPGDSLVGEYGSGKPFYSQLARTVSTKIQKVGTVEQAMAALRGNGVKAAELAWTGLDDFLKGMKPGTKVTRAEVQDYLNTHQVDVHEVVRGDTLPQTWTAPDQAGDQVLFVGGQRVARVENLGNGRFGTYSLGSGLRGLYDTAAEARQAMEEANTATDPTRYSGYVLPGGQPGTYRELVLTTPVGTSSQEARVAELQKKSMELNRQLVTFGARDPEILAQRDTVDQEIDQIRQSPEYGDLRDNIYRSTHWPDDTNPLGHVRFDERVDASGRRVLHIVELQSDWSQAQRSEGAVLRPEELTRRLENLHQQQVDVTNEIGRLENNDPLLNQLLNERATYESIPGAGSAIDVVDRDIAARRTALAGPQLERWRQLRDQQTNLKEATLPPTPFAENFSDLAVKRMLYWAVDHGFDRISWDPGAVHAQRWGTERISWEKVDNTQALADIIQRREEYAALANGRPSETVQWYDQNIKRLQDEPATGYRILAEPQVGGNAGGLDLQGEAEARGLIQRGSPVIVNSLDDLKNHLEQVGFAPSGARETAENRTIADKTWAKMQGSDAGIFTPRKTGLETSYDTLLPQVFNKVGKVFGGKAGEGAVQIGGREPMVQGVPPRRLPGETLPEYRDRTQPPLTSAVHSFDIPPAMKDAVLGEGMPLYSGVHPTVMAQGVKQLVQGAGAVGKWALKNPGKATLASMAAFTALGAYTRAQEQAKTGQQYGDFSSNPTINRIATFGGGAVQPRDFFEGSGIYGDQAILPAAEWAMETIDVVPWGIAKLLGSDPSKTKGGIFNTDHTLAWVGDAFGGPTQSSTSLYDGLRQRSQEYKIDQPLASFALSLPFDPLNWLGWGVGEKTAPKIAEAFAATSKEGIAARISRLEDTQFAMQEGQRSIWNWAGQLSRGARAGQLADEHARLTIMAAGAPTVRASAFLEDVAAKAIKGTASGDELKIANILAKRPTVTEDAVRKLAEDLGVRLEPNDAIEPDLITEISNRVESKHAWTPEDVNWLKDQFDSLRSLENAIQNNVVAWHQGLNGQAATMADFEKLRRLYHVAPNVTFSTGMGAGRPEALKSTLETINQFLNGRPLLRTDGSANLLRPSEVSFIGKMLGRKGWGLTQDTRINAWAAKYGLPDLEPVIKRVQGMSAGDLAGTVAGITRRDFPQSQSALRPWLESHPFALSISNAWDKINEKVGLPLTLSYLGSVGWPVHMARTLVQRNPEITVTQVIPAIARAGVGMGTSAWHAARALPQGPGFAAQELVRGVKSELGNLAFWHNTDLIDQAYWGIYPGSFLHGGHAMGQLKTDVNGMTPGIWPLGRWFFGLNAGDSLKASAAKGLVDIKAARAELTNGVAPTVEQAAQVPAHPLNLLQQAGASVLHNANIAKVYGVASNAVGVMDTSMRQAFVAWQHPIVYKQVLGWLGDKTQIAQQALDRVTARPAALTDASWKRVRSIAELHGASGKMSQLVGTALDGTIDRNAFAQAAFQEPDLPEFMKSELWGVLNRATPKDLTTIFTRGGYADQLLDKVLQQQYTGRVSEALNQIVADLRPKISALNRATPEGKLLYQSTIRDGWQKMEAVLNDQMEMHHRLWQWAYAAKNYAPEGQKDQFFANIVQLRQKLISDGQDEAKGAMRLWRQQILRKGIPFPEDVLKAYDNIYDHILGSFQASDQATKEAWAFTRANSGPGSRQAVSDKWDQVWRQNAETWQNYRGWRDSQQEKIYARIEQYYSAKKGLSPADRASAAQDLLPEPIKTVPDDVRLRAQAALERIRQVSDNFVNHPPVPEDQQQIIRAWATKVDQTAAQLPKDQLDLIQHAHLATANMVMEQGNKRFINYLNRTNLDDAMTKTLFPFWIYDTRGANFYGWMMTHVPGAAESYAREIQDTHTDPQGVGYFQGDYGAFGNEISPNRGLWDYRLVSIAKYMLQNRPGTFGEEAARAFDHVVTEGLFGAHVSPLLGSAAQLATGSQLSDLSQPPLLQQAGDLATQATGQTYQTDSFSRRAIADAMVTNNVDPYHPTPGQQDIATKQAAMQDLAQNTMPMFTRVLPERIAQRSDFSNALVALGHSRAEQALVRAAGKDPWSLVNKEQSDQLMEAHPGWKYLFEESTFSLPPEELQKRIDISDQFDQLRNITMNRMTDQKKIDDQVLGTKDKPATISPQSWMDQRNNRMQQYLGAKDQFTSQPAWQTVQAMLDDPSKQRILKPEDQAVAEYYTLQADLVKKNTDNLGKINWEAVQQGTDAQIAQLTPFQQSYVRNEIVKNQTPVERTWHNALSQKQQFDAIPAWTGISPEMATRKQAAMTALNQLLNTRGADNAQRAAAFARQNNALIHAGRPNPARIRFMLQPENQDFRFWFARASVKNQVASTTLDPAELAPWEYSPTVTGPLVAPDLNAVQDLAAAGG